MKTIITSAIYIFAMTAANLLVAKFGPAISPINAFLFIGLDLTLRDWLHEQTTRVQMLSIVFSGGVVTYLLNPAAKSIAMASAFAFFAASAADWLVFSNLKGKWLFRANGSNVAGAAVDSMIFPVLAFGSLMPAIVLMQFIAKITGGALWSLLINKIKSRSKEVERKGI